MSTGLAAVGMLRLQAVAELPSVSPVSAIPISTVNSVGVFSTFLLLCAIDVSAPALLFWHGQASARPCPAGAATPIIGISSTGSHYLPETYGKACSSHSYMMSSSQVQVGFITGLRLLGFTLSRCGCASAYRLAGSAWTVEFLCVRHRSWTAARAALTTNPVADACVVPVPSRFVVTEVG